MELKTGSRAPDFSLQGSDGQTYTLNSFSGKRLVLYFYPKDDTPGCTIEAIDFTNFLSEFAAKNTVIVGVSSDSASKHQRFIEKHKLGILLLSDPDRTCIKAYSAWGEKKNYGKLSIGLIRSTVLIDEQGIVEKAYYNVRAKGHAESVLRELS